MAEAVTTFAEGTPDVLQKICTRTAQDLAVRKAQTSLEELQERITEAEAPRGFIRALKTKAASGLPALIAEIKKASPSKGLIREDFAPSKLAQAYTDGGAACLSVLTDTPFFQGHMDYLQEAKSACALPVLRKDFMLDPYQVYEARAIGADCILLIVAALEDAQMRTLYDLSTSLGMDVLIEVHDKTELERALLLSPEMIGVNNRNLKTLEVNIQTSHDLAAMMPGDCLRVAESGIATNADLQKLQCSGYNTFLVGESLMRKHDVTQATRELLGTE